MNLKLFGQIVHEILMDGNFSNYKKCSERMRRSIDAFVISLRCKGEVPVHSGDLVMDIRPSTYGKLYTVKSIKVHALLETVVVMKQNGVVLKLNQFQSRVN